MKRILIAICIILLLVLMITFPSTGISGCKNGLTLFCTILLPTLFPFMLLTSILRLLVPALSSKPLLVIIGILSGYPTGAKLISDQCTAGILPVTTAQTLIGLSNLASPAFVLTFTGSHILSLGNKRFLFYGLILFGTMLGSYIVGHLFPQNNPCKSNTSSSIMQKKGLHPSLYHRVDSLLLDCLLIMLKIGGYIMIFSIVNAFLLLLLPKSSLLFPFIAGFLEVTTGISYLPVLICPQSIKIVLAAGLIGFGGMCSLFQTKSVMTAKGLSSWYYFIQKMASGLTSSILCTIFCLLGLFV